jgi:hypothetical protein
LIVTLESFGPADVNSERRRSRRPPKGVKSERRMKRKRRYQEMKNPPEVRLSENNKAPAGPIGKKFGGAERERTLEL